MRTLKKLFTFTLLFAMSFANAQDLMSELDSVPNEKQAVTAAFKGLQICNLQSTKLPAKGEWYFLVSHRFGDLSNGFENFFGLDGARTKLAGIWGVTNWLSLGVSRHTYGKTYELAAKYRLLNQVENGFPFTVVGYNTMDINSELKKDANPGLEFSNRLAFSSQLLISRKFSENFSLELAPIFIHKNLYDDATEKKDEFLIAGGLRYKVSKRISLNVEGVSRLNHIKYSIYKNPITFGMDIDTGGHIFQMVFSNSQLMNDVATYTNASGKWFDKGMYFGFNMYRVF